MVMLEWCCTNWKIRSKGSCEEGIVVMPRLLVEMCSATVPHRRNYEVWIVQTMVIHELEKTSNRMSVAFPHRLLLLIIAGRLASL